MTLINWFLLHQITKHRGAAIQHLLRLSGRLQLVMAQVNFFASSYFVYLFWNLSTF